MSAQVMPAQVVPAKVAPTPSHYALTSLQPIHVIQAWSLGFELGNAVKYIRRAGHKGPIIEDLAKARQYCVYVLELMQADVMLLEWRDRPHAVRGHNPMAVAMVWQLSTPLTSALRAIHDIACSPVSARRNCELAIAQIDVAIEAASRAVAPPVPAVA